MSTVGVIGSGSFGQKRVQTLLELDDLVKQIVIFDPVQEVSAKVVRTFNSPQIIVVSSLEELLQFPKLSSVCICTPNNLHAELSAQALLAGKHVLCEKPITRESNVMTELLALAKKQHKLLVSGTNHRYFPSVQRALDIIHSGKIGSVYSFHGNIGTNGKRIQDSWFWQKQAAGGGTFIDNGHHLLDLALLFCGTFSHCIGHSSTRHWQNAEVEDYAMAVFSTPATVDNSGYEAVLRSSWRQPNGYLDIEVWGSHGSLSLSIGKDETLTVNILDEAPQVEDFNDQPKHSLHQELRTFFRSTKNLHPESTSHLLELTKMIEAFYTSQSTGQRSIL